MEGGNCDKSFCLNGMALQKLEKCMDINNAFSWQLIVRGILETFCAAGSIEEDSITILWAMIHLSSDGEPTVHSDQFLM